MAIPLLALGKAYAANKAKNYLTSQVEDALGVPKDSIAVATNPLGFGKKVIGDVLKDTAKNAVMDNFVERPSIPEEDRSFTSTGGNKLQELDAMEYEGDYKRGGKVKSAAKSKANTASRRGDGIAQRGKTKGRYL
jgi:hypothetical protein